ncbi:serpin B3 [Solenopsis invicta]|uniref:serpin B3 n=1 Tax=Solenopsis invicta TaxID=13686 RepID=UPI00059623F2|nr:serpin B3 [Solenopsis invicta]XP_025992832.1 serpin B3 [Solenopsis invicta]XP_025992833.1 serpin B3 [Solenopsis invicta]
MLTESRFKFALESLKKYVMMENEKAFLFSPDLIYHNLLMIYFGVRDENFLREILHIPDYISRAVIKQYYAFGGNLQFFRMTEPEDPYTRCAIYSRFWISKTKNIKNTTHELFNSHHQVMDYVFAINPERGRKFVNNTITCITKHKIKNLLPPDSINRNTEGVLFNALYCNGELDGNFELNITDIKDHTSQYLGARIIEIPVKKRNISTFFLFPRYSDKNNVQKDGIIQLMERLTTEETSLKLHEFLDNRLRIAGSQKRSQKKHPLPIFKIEEELRTNELLEILGIPELIPRGTIELVDFTKESLKLGDIVHRINIEMTKKNFTASASNAFFTNCSCQFERTHINKSVARNKCICLIYNRFQRNILFCGVV